ncbi:MAG: lysophospholipid acyltransferase family protein [Microthrixaceae bacterium]|jgi:1-acyl-sn-glycerol-3-phosphate acyltransferase
MAIQEPADGRSGSSPSADEGVTSPGSTGDGRRQRAGLGVTIVSIWSWFVFGFCVAVWVPLMLVTYLVTLPFDRGRYWTGYLYRKVPVVQQTLNPLWRFRITGDLPADPRNPYVVVSNHESFVDILLISHLPWEMKWLSKEQNFKIPVAGWLMSLAGDVRLRRGDKASAQRAMDACADYLSKRVSVMIFPEGTRAADGELGQFKDGAFRLAIETQVPILPLAVAGTKEALRKHDWRFGRANAEVHVMAPVPTEGLTLDDVDELRERVRDLISDQLATMKSS